MDDICDMGLLEAMISADRDTARDYRKLSDIWTARKSPTQAIGHNVAFLHLAFLGISDVFSAKGENAAKALDFKK
jgi:hypothetical protein